jgi:hypothetical protein
VEVTVVVPQAVDEAARKRLTNIEIGFMPDELASPVPVATGLLLFPPILPRRVRLGAVP